MNSQYNPPRPDAYKRRLPPSATAGLRSGATLSIFFVLSACGIELADPYAISEEDARAGETGPSADDDSVRKAIFDTPGSDCSAPQQRSIEDAELLAHQYLVRADGGVSLVALFPTEEAIQIFNNHFDARTFDDVMFVWGTYQGIRRHLTDTIYLCRTDDHPDCIDGKTAITNGATNVVRLCPIFFTPEVAIRGRAQTIIHELSHRNSTSPSGIGTDDLDFPSIHNAHQYGRYAPRCFEDTCFPL